MLPVSDRAIVSPRKFNISLQPELPLSKSMLLFWSFLFILSVELLFTSKQEPEGDEVALFIDGIVVILRLFLSLKSLFYAFLRF